VVVATLVGEKGWFGHPHLTEIRVAEYFGGGSITPIWPRGWSIQPIWPEWGWCTAYGVSSATQEAKWCWSFFFFFFFFFLKKKKKENNDILEINTYIWDNFEIFVPKNACAAHVSHFQSKKTEMANCMHWEFWKLCRDTLQLFKH